MKIKNKFGILSAVALTSLLLSGCSFTPYKDDFTCTKGAGEGSCDSVSNVYLQTLKKGSENKTESRGTEIVIEDIVDIEAIEESCRYLFFFTDEECVNNKYKEYVLLMEENEQVLNDIVYYQHLRNEKIKLDKEMER